MPRHQVQITFDAELRGHVLHVRAGKAAQRIDVERGIDHDHAFAQCGERGAHLAYRDRLGGVRLELGKVEVDALDDDAVAAEHASDARELGDVGRREKELHRILLPERSGHRRLTRGQRSVNHAHNPAASAACRTSPTARGIRTWKKLWLMPWNFSSGPKSFLFTNFSKPQSRSGTNEPIAAAAAANEKP